MDYVVAKSTYHTGVATMLSEGQIFRADDPFVKAHPDDFVPLEESAQFVGPPEAKAKTEPVVEEATANPGEKRATKKS